MKLQAMKKTDYSNIKSIEQLRVARIDNKCRMIRAEAKMKDNLLSLRKSLRPENILKEIVGEYLMFLSRFCLYRRIYRSLLSFFRKRTY